MAGADPELADAAGVIATPDRRLRVFVSSTLEELAVERAAVRAAVRRLHLTPVMFDLGARAHLPQVAVDGRGGPWNSFIFFSDPDGNGWTVQERPAQT